MNAPHRQHGFTILEMLGTVLIASMVLTGVMSFYLQLSDQMERASKKNRAGRSAAQIVDRVARDLEGAYLVMKPEAMDPLEHPWLFYAEERYSSDGADRLRFVVMNHVPRQQDGPTANLAIVSYRLQQDEELGGYQLLRWVRPGLPPGLERDLPTDESSAVVMAEGLSDFGVKLQTEDGEWVSRWDSSQIVDSSQLPIAAEVGLALLDLDALELGDEEPGERYARRVVLPIRPIDLPAMMEEVTGGAGEDDDDLLGDEDDEEEDDELGEDGELADGGCDTGPTLRECIQANAPNAQEAIAAVGAGGLDECAPPSINLPSIGLSVVCQ